MKRGRADGRVSRSMFSLKNYLLFFVLVSFVVTCCFLLFLGYAKIDYSEIGLQKAAIATLGNVLFLSLILSLLDGVRRKFTVERPVKRILNATRRLTEGDFSVRIQPFHRLESSNELDAIIENFNKMAQELSGIEALRTDFIASVSHELKTPLAVIQNYATLLQDPQLPAKTRLEYAKTITQASRRLSELITNILKLNKLENQQIFPETREYELGEQLRECLLGFEDVWEKKELEIEADIADVTIKGDPELLTLVWNNLFSNAVKFTPPGGRVAVRLYEREGSAVVQVSDTGCGMTPEVGRHIFEKFYQGDAAHATQGNGLGLALVKRVVDITGGELAVESKLGQGSTFTVTLHANPA